MKIQTLTLTTLALTLAACGGKDTDATTPGGTATPATTAPLEGFVMPPHDTKH